MRHTSLSPISFVLAIASAMIAAGCGNSGDVVKLVEERDSLRTITELQNNRLGSYVEMIQVINSTLDSISAQEDGIFMGNGEMPVTKDDVRSNLTRFELILKKQRQRIDQLEKELNERNDSGAATNSLIAHLRDQIEQKDRQIANLRNELEKKNVSIAQLQEQVESQRTTITVQQATIDQLNTRTQKQGEALARQDAILNNGYVLIGSKDDLKRKGVISKKGALLSDAVLDRSKFAKVDIRNWREVSFTAKKPRVITPMPPSSYEITLNGKDNFTLTIKNPTDFWGVSNYLVIQTN